MLHGLAARQPQPETPELLQIETLARAKSPLHRLDRFRARTHAVKFHAVARVEHHKLRQPRQAAQVRAHRLGSPAGQRQLLAHFQRRALMRRPEQKQHAPAHRCSTPPFSAGTSAVRLRSTSQSVASASTKSTRLSRANRTPDRRPCLRAPSISA